MRLIDADTLIDDIKNCLWDWESVDGITATTVLKQTITDINNQPSVDAVPVVRCKDCVHLGFKDFRGICEHGPVCTMIAPDSYCAWGRKKEDTP